MPTPRERQVKDAMAARERQVKATEKEELERLVQGDVRYRWWRGRAKGDPGFLYTTEAVECFGKRGWVSWIERQDATQMPGVTAAITESFVLHKTRNAAKARAWNLYQGWRLAEGLSTSWGSFA